MRILPTCLFLITITIINAQLFQGYQPGQTREKRQNNVYQFLRHLLASSSISQEDIPHEYSSLYQIPGSHRVVVNVNQPDSKPTTIINNLHPEYLSQCPCERYVRGPHNELQCLCPIKRIYTQCHTNKVCVEKRYCDHGLLFDIRVLQTVNRQNTLCDESTHVCCLPPTTVHHEINNHFVNSSVDVLNNTFTKYVVGGDLYVNNGNPSTQFKTKSKGTVQLSSLPENQQLQPVQPTEQSSQQVQNAGFNVGLGNIPSQQIPTSQIPVQTSQFDNRSPIGTQQGFLGSEAPLINQQFVGNNPTFIPNENKNPVQLNFVPTTESNLPTTPFIQPTNPPVVSTSPVFQSKVKEQQVIQTGFTNDITTFKPSTTTFNTDDELLSIFGTPDVTEFPGLNLQSPQADQNKQSVDVNIIQNTPLSQMDFPQPGFQAPKKQPEIFLTGKIERFRNNNKMNATSTSSQRTTTTTTESVFQGIRQRISIDGGVNVRPTAPAFTQVQEQEMFSFQESTPIQSAPVQYTPPTTRPSNFQAPADTRQIVRACPTAMKCVQEMYCTPEGSVSIVPVILTKEEEIRKNMLLTCGDQASGQIGKCCFDNST